MALDEITRELISIGAAISANSPPEVKYHIARARELGVQDAELNDAVEVGRLVRRGAASKTDLFAVSLATTPPVRERGACRKGGGGKRKAGDGCGCDAGAAGVSSVGTT